MNPTELIILCQTLIQTPSVNGRDPERAVAEIGADYARQHGLTVTLPALDPERPNLLVRAGPQDRMPGLLLVAHLDTVAEGDLATWHYPAFGGQIDSGRIYGRGACDTKGGLAAALGAMVLAEERGIPALLIGVPDEEAGATGTLGVKYLHASGLLTGRGAIYAYPGNHEIILGHRGVLRVQITTRGQAMHTGSLEWQNAPIGYNAIAGMNAILAGLEELRFADAMPKTLFAPYRTVITPTMISGGTGPSMVPASCEAFIDCRLVPAVGPEVVLAAIQQLAELVARRRPPLQVQIRVVAEIPPTQISEQEAVVQAALAAAHTILGQKPQLAVSGPANESYLLNGFGIPTCIIGPTGGNAHAADEYVEIDSLLQLAEVYATIAGMLVV